MKSWIRIFLLLVVIVAAQPWLGSKARGASCVLECMSHWSCANPAGQHCSDEQSRAYSLCEIRRRGANAPGGAGWGAIAYSARDHISGWSYEHDYKGTAVQVALQYCNRERGVNCVIQVTFYNSCGAVAADGDAVASGTGPSKAGAEQKALGACSLAGGKRCAVQASACSGAASGSTTATAPSAPPAPRATSWGAIAYSSKDFGAGWSQGKSDRASAENEALGVCAQRGRNCILQTAFNKQCGALAADRDFFGWGTSGNQRESQQRAIEECRKDGGARCVLRGHSPPKMSLLVSRANPNPTQNPKAMSPITSGPRRVTTRGLSMALMSGGAPDINTNSPTKILALRVRAAFWPSVNSASFGIRPAYRA